MSNITVRQIKHGSEEYEQSLLLRNEILRVPLGMDIAGEDLSCESADIHIGAFDKDSLVGVLVFSPVDKSTIHMRQVAVSAACQSKGIGSQMVKFSEQVAQQNGYSKIVLHARNTAIEFYRKLCYSVVGEEFTEVSIPHHEMQKTL